jgi:hypothetical protein
MFTYEESVLSYADMAGNLTYADAAKLLGTMASASTTFTPKATASAGPTWTLATLRRCWPGWATDPASLGPA